MTKTIVFYALLIIALFLAPLVGFESFLHTKKWIILSFFVASSYINHSLIEQGMRNKREKFIQFYLITIVIRFITALLFIGILLYFGLENVNLFIINFIVFYLFFTMFEIINLYRKLRRFS